MRRRWVSIALLAVLGVGGALAFSLASTPVYSARAQVFVSVRGSDTTGDLLQGANFTVRQVRSYVQVATTERVLQPVIDELGLPETPETLAERVTADSPIDTVLINVRADDESAAQAAAIANAVARSLADVVRELETPEGRGESPVEVSTVRTATVPRSPSSPNTRMNLALGLMVGLAGGFALAVLREVLDTRVRDVTDVEDLTDAGVLGAIPFAEDSSAKPLILHEPPGSPRAEAYRRLRTNLQFLEFDGQQRATVFTSSVAAEGKSSTVLNLAITIANAGSSVVVVDADLRRPSVAKYLGIEGAVGLTTVLIGRATIDDVLQPWGNGNLDVIAAGAVPPNPSELLGSENMAQVIEELANRYDVVLVDTAPLLPVTDGAVLAKLVGGAVVVAGAGEVHRSQLEASLDALATVQARVLGVVVNRVPAKGHGAYAYGYYEYTSTAPATAGGSRAAKRKARKERKDRTPPAHSSGEAHGWVGFGRTTDANAATSAGNADEARELAAVGAAAPAAPAPAATDAGHGRAGRPVAEEDTLPAWLPGHHGEQP